MKEKYIFIDSILYSIHIKGKINPSEWRAPKNSKERYKSLSKWTMQRDREREKKRMEKTKNLFKKIRDTKGTFHTKMGTIKYRK